MGRVIQVEVVQENPAQGFRDDRSAPADPAGVLDANALTPIRWSLSNNQARTLDHRAALAARHVFACQFNMQNCVISTVPRP